MGLLFWVKLYQVQVIQHDYFIARADRQYVRQSSSVFDRGNIYFETRDGSKVSAAKVEPGFILAINPSRVTDPEGTLRLLLEIVPDIDAERFLMQAEKLEDPYEEVTRQLTEDQKDQITELDLDGVSLYKHQWRYYPGERLAAQTLGFLSKSDGENLSAQYGLEKYYDDVLQRNEDDVYVNFFAQIFGSLKDTVSDKKDRKGDIITTIEPTVQKKLQEVLLDVMEVYDSEKTGGIIMDPQTGEIVALGALPDFNPNTFSSVDSFLQFSNPIVEDVYEMGSIMKPLSVAIGLDTGKADNTTMYDDKGQRTLDGRTFFNYDKRVRGLVSLQDILNNSLNTGVAHIAIDLVGKKVFGEYMLKLLGGETGIDLPREQSPLVSNLESDRDIEFATSSFGQGIAVTPIGMIRALAALGNGGKLIEPHVVKRIDYTIGPDRITKFPPEEQVFTEETSEKISRLLVNVVDDALKGGNVALKNHSIAAKTGTAQLARPSGGYFEDKYLHSFFGYFPAYDPKYIILLYTVDPRGVQYASQTLTDPFMDLTKFLINYYSINPDRGI